MDLLKLFSNICFWIGFGSLGISVLLFESGTRYMKTGEKLKRKKVDKVAWKFLAVSGIFFGLALVLGLL